MATISPLVPQFKDPRRTRRPPHQPLQSSNIVQEVEDNEPLMDIDQVQNNPEIQPIQSSSSKKPQPVVSHDYKAYCIVLFVIVLILTVICLYLYFNRGVQSEVIEEGKQDPAQLAQQQVNGELAFEQERRKNAAMLKNQKEEALKIQKQQIYMKQMAELEEKKQMIMKEREAREARSRAEAIESALADAEAAKQQKEKVKQNNKPEEFSTESTTIIISQPQDLPRVASVAQIEVLEESSKQEPVEETKKSKKKSAN